MKKALSPTLSIICIVMLGMLMSSCVVSKKKFEASEDARWSALYSRDSLASLLKASRSECSSLVSDTTMLGSSLRNYKALLANNKSENQKLNEQLAQKINDIIEREKTIAEMQKVIDEQTAKVKNLLDNVKSALNGFSDDELTVREEDGKVYVAMSDKLLFQSGSATVNDEGKKALGKLAEVLNRQTDIDVYIEGHTDSIPIKTVFYKDNWDLSVIRATSVVRILTETYGVKPLQIQPCGRGEYKPVDTNATAEGRARNRRTEIIMAPNLDKLYQMLKQ